MQKSLSELLADKFIICSCEGIAEKVIIELLLDNQKLCFERSALVDEECTNLRSAKDIESNFLTRAYSKDIAILRILDKENERFKISPVYLKSRIVEVYEVVTKPEIEMIHIHAEGLFQEFQRALRANHNLRPSSFFQGYATKTFRRKSKVKTAEFITDLYSCDIPKLIKAIELYHQNSKQDSFDLSNLLIGR